MLMTMKSLNINSERLLADLHKLRSFGAEENGVVRPAFSSKDLDSRAWLRERFAEAGLTTQIDGVGNVFGWSQNKGKSLLLGSHSDTQPEGGWLDGALGVIYALEVARALSEFEETKGLAVDIVSWSDEEGAFLTSLGSKSFCRQISDKQLSEAKNADGRSLVDAIEDAGFSKEPAIHFDGDNCIGYLEAHIEQGPYLEASNKKIGVVTAIVGVRDFRIEFLGEQNHAGTTPMSLRRDAVTATVKFCHRLSTSFEELAKEATVWTFGAINVLPNAPSIVPARVELSLQFRDGNEGLLDAMEEVLYRLVSDMNCDEPVEVTVAGTDDIVSAAAMDEIFQAQIGEAADLHAPGNWISMPSGAGHDAQVMADVVPCGMVFVPSIGGVSHSFSEDTSEGDIIRGCNVFAAATARILQNR
jgi:beta-ureidopropionase / N-carbamoyl-L-amino-acid hydrolase